MKKIKTSISLREDTHARMLERAESEHRTISNMLESVIEKIFGFGAASRKGRKPTEHPADNVSFGPPKAQPGTEAALAMAAQEGGAL